MADTHEADRPGLTADAAVRELFARLPSPGKDVVWLADELISVAQHLDSFALELRSGAEGPSLAGSSDSNHWTVLGRGPARLFRPLLARFAVLGADESGGEPQVYGGRFALVRSSRVGPVRLEVAFANTPEKQCLSLTRVPLATRPRTDSAASADAPPQPSA